MKDKLINLLKKWLGVRQPGNGIGRVMRDEEKAKLFKDSFAAGLDYVDE